MQQVEIFNSINEFMQKINTRGENKYYKGRYLGSKNETKKSSGTENYNEADDLFRGGWLEGRKYLEALTTQKKAFAPAPAYKRERRVAGGRIHVGALIAGSDKVFNKRIKTFRDASNPVITLFLNTAVPYNITAEQIATTAGCLFSAVRNLEAEGYKVELYLGLVLYCKKKKQNFANMIRLKSSCEQLSETKMLYPIVHPSFLRRHGLRWIETSSITPAYMPGYGRPIVYANESKRVINTAGKKIQACISLYESLNSNPEAIMESIKKQRAEAVKK